MPLEKLYENIFFNARNIFVPKHKKIRRKKKKHYLWAHIKVKFFNLPIPQVAWRHIKSNLLKFIKIFSLNLRGFFFSQSFCWLNVKFFTCTFCLSIWYAAPSVLKFFFILKKAWKNSHVFNIQSSLYYIESFTIHIKTKERNKVNLHWIELKKSTNIRVVVWFII